MKSPEKWEIQLPAYLPNDQPPVVIRNGEDISDQIRSITIRAGVNEVTTIQVEYLMATVNSEVVGFE